MRIPSHPVRQQADHSASAAHTRDGAMHVLDASQEFSYRAVDQLDSIRVTTDPDFYQDNPESTEFWTLGNPLFPAPSVDLACPDDDGLTRLGELF